MTDQNSLSDNLLLKRFEHEILEKVPHLQRTAGGDRVVNPTPLVDITQDLIECAKSQFGIDLADKDLKVFGKFDSGILGGSIKSRPAVWIVHDAIKTGKLKQGQAIFEATSGNFCLLYTSDAADE